VSLAVKLAHDPAYFQQIKNKVLTVRHLCVCVCVGGDLTLHYVVSGQRQPFPRSSAVSTPNRCFKGFYLLCSSSDFASHLNLCSNVVGKMAQAMRVAYQRWRQGLPSVDIKTDEVRSIMFITTTTTDNMTRFSLSSLCHLICLSVISSHVFVVINSSSSLMIINPSHPIALSLPLVSVISILRTGTSGRRECWRYKMTLLIQLLTQRRQTSCGGSWSNSG